MPGPPLEFRVVGVGYQYGEVPLAAISKVKSSVKFKPTKAPKPVDECRKPIQVSLGPHIPGVAPIKPNPDHSGTTQAGLCKRFLTEPPEPDRQLLAELTAFVNKWLEENMQPLDPGADVSVETWLERSNYPKWRKDELQKLWSDNAGILSPRDFIVKSFVKDETYPEFKHARGINSRTDMFKCAVGPVFRLIEKELFAREEFIKKIPVADRPRYIYDKLKLECAQYFEGDFVSYEAHFTRVIMEAIEFRLFAHMVKSLPDGNEWMDLVRNVIGGTNHCVYKYFTVDVEATRMSGEMDTSLANGFVNLMLILFLFSKKGTPCKTVIEGDDSLTAFVGEPPSKEDFAAVGFTIKCSVHDNIEDTSFCQLIFHPKDLINITDPLEVLANFGWAGKAYVNAKTSRLKTLLRCKALSYAHQYPGCPIIQSLAHYALRATSGYDVRHFVENDRSLSLWERDQLRAAIMCKRPDPTPIPMDTRLLMQRWFGVSVELQVEIEQYLDSLDKLQPLLGPIPFLNYHDHLFRYAETYVVEVLRKDVTHSVSLPWHRDRLAHHSEFIVV